MTRCVFAFRPSSVSRISIKPLPTQAIERVCVDAKLCRRPNGNGSFFAASFARNSTSLRAESMRQLAAAQTCDRGASRFGKHDQSAACAFQSPAAALRETLRRRAPGSSSLSNGPSSISFGVSAGTRSSAFVISRIFVPSRRAVRELYDHADHRFLAKRDDHARCPAARFRAGIPGRRR